MPWGKAVVEVCEVRLELQSPPPLGSGHRWLADSRSPSDAHFKLSAICHYDGSDHPRNFAKRRDATLLR